MWCGRRLQNLSFNTKVAFSTQINTDFGFQPSLPFFTSPFNKTNDLSGHYFHTDTTSDVDFATKLVSDIFKCQPERGYYKHANEANNRFLFKHNFRFWNTCDKLLMGSAACFMPLLSEQSCPLFPIRTIKLVRMRMKHAKMLFDDPEVGKGLQIGNSNSLKPNQT